uniref:glycosyltransferase 87 family protein n=1 Tax=Clostridium sp. NkU-1 TaxID=1095009 RepID=UPI0006D1E5A0
MLLPIKILEVIVQKSISIHYVIIYINIIIGFLLIYSGTLIHKLSVCFGADTEEAKIVKYIYLLSPITLFSTVGFGQMDIFGVIVMLWALIFYMNERMNTFSLLISVAIALKAFPLFIFIPLVLLIEKRLIYIIKYFVFGLSCPLVFKVVYGRDPVYVEMKKAFENFYGFTGRLFQSQIEGAHGAISLFMLLVFIVCFACYYHNVEKECLWKYVIIVPLVIYSGFSILIQWHPQYLIIYSVFLAQAFLISKEKNRFLVLEFFYWIRIFGNYIVSVRKKMLIIIC